MNPALKAIIFTGLLAVIGYFSAHPQSAPVKTDLTPPGILSALGGLFILVLLIERLTEIAIAIGRQSETDIKKAELAMLEADPTKAAEVQQRRAELASFQAKTKSAALTIGFALSVIACAGGVGILETILDTTKADPSFIRAIDIVLTAGLLAGGSDAFHQFVRALEIFFQNARK